MGKEALHYSFVLIALYLGVAYATGSGVLLDKSTAGGVNLVKAFQGRG